MKVEMEKGRLWHIHRNHLCRKNPYVSSQSDLICSSYGQNTKMAYRAICTVDIKIKINMDRPSEVLIRTTDESSSKGTPKREYQRIFLFDTIIAFHLEFTKLGKLHRSDPRVSKNIPFRYRWKWSLEVPKIR
jgi:hypothetical protein